MEQQTSRILVVDDEAPIRITLERLLQRRGYSVIVAASASSPLALLDQHTFDLLLLASCPGSAAWRSPDRRERSSRLQRFCC
jgi:CheY-like chemotaxis protein